MTARAGERRADRVLMVTPRYLPDVGGVETHVHEVSRRLAADGLDVTVLATDRTRSLPAAERSAGVEIRRVPAWPARRDYYFAPRVFGAIREGRWDVVHVQSYHTLVPPLAMAAALRSGMPFVLTFHGGGHSSHLRSRVRPGQLLALRPLLARAARLVAVAEFEVERYARILRVPRDRFAVIPNGVELPPLGDAPLPAEPVVLSVGRLERYKGHHRLLAALPAILARRPSARLVIAGSGPYEAPLRELAERLGVADRVEIRFVPSERREEMATVYAEASVVVLLSDWETHPLAALEALAAGRPLVVAATSGLRELGERRLARTVPLDAAPEDVAAAILEQLDRPLTTDAVALPTWDECAARLRALYDAVARVR